MKALTAPFRVGEWWEHKLAPMLGTAYATAFLIHRSLLASLPAIFITLVAVTVGGAYVSVVNDFTDIESDRRAGKPNRLAERPRWAGPIVLGTLVAAGVVIAVLRWRHDTLTLIVYAGAWVAFSLYSIPPVRLKGRGFAGAVADAAGAHVFPHLLMAVIVFDDAHVHVRVWWLVLIGAWSLAAGIRGALLHQLGDVEADRLAGVRAFGTLHPRLGHDIGVYVALPLELGLITAIVIAAGNPLALALLPAYLLLERARARHYRIPTAVVSRAPRARVLMQTYYACLYPLAFLIACAFQHPAAAMVLVIHLIAFNREPRDVVIDTYLVVRY